MMVICDACRGTKSHVVLGGFIRNCVKCNGIGRVESNDEDQVEIEILKKKNKKQEISNNAHEAAP